MTDRLQRQFPIIVMLRQAQEGFAHRMTSDADLSVDLVVYAIAMKGRCLRSFPASSYSSTALNTNPLLHFALAELVMRSE
jgi:hypothetical protein